MWLLVSHRHYEASGRGRCAIVERAFVLGGHLGITSSSSDPPARTPHTYRRLLHQRVRAAVLPLACRRRETSCGHLVPTAIMIAQSSRSRVTQSKS